MRQVLQPLLIELLEECRELDQCGICLLDTGEIDFHVMNIFEWLTKNRYTVDSEYAREDLMVSPMFEALFDTNIIWKSKYYEHFQVEH